ncbi:hypothetical protein [Listeria rocourtiae]|uniref:hypothetical protein n=1 Tax=Listeria rocourtiae TaxID=647910 RepID=UPI00131F198F|nr:hypothetical protein [Listeria rocourtiae]
MIIVYLVLAIICLMVITAFYGKINIRKHWIGIAALVLLAAMMAIFFQANVFCNGQSVS